MKTNWRLIFACRRKINPIDESFLMLGLLYLAAFVFGVVFFPETQVFNLMTLLLACVIILTSCFSIIILEQRQAKTFLLVGLFILYLFVLPRILQFLIWPAGVTIANGVDLTVGGQLVTAGMVNAALIFLFLGFLSFILGAYSIGRFIDGRVKTQEMPKLIMQPYSNLTLYSCFFFVLLAQSDDLQMLLYRSVTSILTLPISSYNFHALLQLVFNIDVAFFAIVAFSTMSYILGGRHSSLGLISMVFVYVILKTIGGSRAGALLALLFVFLTMISYREFAAISLKRIFLFCSALAIISIISFPLATSLRGNEDRNEQVEGTIGLIRGGGGIAAGNVLNARKNNNHLLLKGILDRVGAVVDSVIVVTGIKGDGRLKEHFVSVEYGLKSAVNIIFPGVIFKCCQINSSFLPPFVYGGREEGLLYTDGYYESSYWTAFGLSYLLFGSGGGALAALFFAGAVLAAGFWLLRRHQGFYIFLPAYLWLGVYMFLIMQGLDAFFADFQKFGLCYGIFVILVMLLERAYKSIGILK